MNHTLSHSCIRAPRGNVTTVVLLIAFFLAVGLVMIGASPAIAVAGPRHFDSAALTVVDWLFGGWGK